jgi:tetratricopeptide (TPR) repeat protein
MAVVYTEQGDYAQALSCYGERLQIDLALDDRLSLAKTAGNMGMVYAGLGDYAHALACYSFLLKVTLELGDRQNVLVATGNMISVYTAQGEYAVAGRLSRRAITLGRALNVPLYLCEFLHARADLLARRSRRAEAIALCDEAAAMAAGIGRTDIQLPALLLSLRLRQQTGELDTAAAADALKSLRDAWPEEQQQAAILYELWQLDESAASLRQQTAALYHNLYARTPDVTYRRRYQELTGEAVPAPLAAPSPPAVVAGSATDLEKLLVQVDRLIAGLAATT